MTTEIFDYYEVLGLKRNANDRQIRNAYKELTLKYHPDKNQKDKKEAETMFKKINEAYSTLSNEDKKEIYDKFGHRSLLEAQAFSGEYYDEEEDEDVKATYDALINGFASCNQSYDDYQAQKKADEEMSPFIQALFGQNSANSNIKYNYNQVYEKSEDDVNGRIEEGVQVKIKNLQKNTELNGKKGKILKYNKRKDRYQVQVKSRIVNLKRDNFMQMVKGRVYMPHERDFNFRRGQIIEYNEEDDVYTIKFYNQIMDFKSDQFAIQRRTAVELKNLKNRPDLNGKYGIVRNFDRRKAKYDIILENGKRVFVKSINVKI